MIELSLKNRNAIVCGGSKGIGKAIGIALAQMGANITLVARNADHLGQALKDLQKLPGQDHQVLIADLSNPDDLKKKISTLAQNQTYHILINNSGGPAGGSLLGADPAELQKAFVQHVVSSQLLAKHLVPGMQKDAYGRIINIISTSVKEPIDGLGVSNTIRGAMGNWSKTMANELGRFNITVNNILPGFTMTERLEEIISTKAAKTGRSIEAIEAEMKSTVPLGRFASPMEIASVAAFLASPAAGYVNSINVPVDGGRTRSL